MDSFFKDIEPALAESIQKDVPEGPLSNFIHNYKGPDSGIDRQRALVPFLSDLIKEQHGSSDLDNARRRTIIQDIGYVQSGLEDWPGAASTWQSIVDTDDTVSPEDHPDRDLAAMFNLGIALNRMEQYKKAETVFTRLLPMLAAKPKLGKSSQQYVGSLGALMHAVGKQGKVEEARKLYSEHSQITDSYDEPEYSAHTSYAKAMLSEIEHEARER